MARIYTHLKNCLIFKYTNNNRIVSIKTQKFKIVDNRGKRTYPCKDLLTKVECCNTNNWKNASGVKEAGSNPYCASKWQKKSNNDTDRCIKFPKSNYVYPRGYGTNGYVLCKA